MERTEVSLIVCWRCPVIRNAFCVEPPSAQFTQEHFRGCSATAIREWGCTFFRGCVLSNIICFYDIPQESSCTCTMWWGVRDLCRGNLKPRLGKNIFARCDCLVMISECLCYFLLIPESKQIITTEILIFVNT